MREERAEGCAGEGLLSVIMLCFYVHFIILRCSSAFYGSQHSTGKMGALCWKSGFPCNNLHTLFSLAFRGNKTFNFSTLSCMLSEKGIHKFSGDFIWWWKILIFSSCVTDIIHILWLNFCSSRLLTFDNEMRYAPNFSLSLPYHTHVYDIQNDPNYYMWVRWGGSMFDKSQQQSDEMVKKI